MNDERDQLRDQLLAELGDLVGQQPWEEVARNWAGRLVDGQPAWDTPTACLRLALRYIDELRAAITGSDVGPGGPLPGPIAQAEWTPEDQAFFERLHRRRGPLPPNTEGSAA